MKRYIALGIADAQYKNGSSGNNYVSYSAIGISFDGKDVKF